MDGNSIYGTDLSISLDSVENERVLLAKLGTKHIEIDNFKTAINSFSERNENVDKYETQLDTARSEYNKILNRLNIIRMKTRSESTDNLQKNQEVDNKTIENSENTKYDKLDLNKNITAVYSDNNLETQSYVDKVIY